jgi:hypothetical protein
MGGRRRAVAPVFEAKESKNDYRRERKHSGNGNRDEELPRHSLILADMRECSKIRQTIPLMQLVYIHTR